MHTKTYQWKVQVLTQTHDAIATPGHGAHMLKQSTNRRRSKEEIIAAAKRVEEQK